MSNPIEIFGFKICIEHKIDPEHVYMGMATALIMQKDSLSAREYIAKVSKKSYGYSIAIPDKNGEISFRIKDFKEAESVAISGTFNDYSTTQNLFVKQRNGDWLCKLKLPKGDYAYKFVINASIWVTDPHNHLLIKPNKYWDSRLMVF